MHVKDQFGKKVDIFITLAGVDSKQWRTAQIELRRALMAGADSLEATADAMSKCSISWRGPESNGEPLEFSKESVRNLYISAPYIIDQADEYLSNRVNFTKSKDASLSNLPSGLSTSTATSADQG